MEETKFTRIKRAVETEKRKQVQGESKLEALGAESKRIFTEASEVIGKPIASKEDLSAFLDQQKAEIEQKIAAAEEILQREGVDY